MRIESIKTIKNNNNIENVFLHADSRKALKLIKDNYIDMIITSPPYDYLRSYNNNSKWNFEIFKVIAQEMYRVLKDGGVAVWVVGDQVIKGNKSLTSFKQAIYFQDMGFNVYDVIIYEKSGTGPPHKNRYFNGFEYMFVLSKGLPKTINLLQDKPNKWAGYSTYGDVTRREKDGSLTKKGKKIVAKYGIRTNIWRYNNGKGQASKNQIAHKHPAIFPEKLVEDHIKSWTLEGDLILDPFGGSGTTALVSRQLKRRFIHVEIDKQYCNIALERYLQHENL